MESLWVHAALGLIVGLLIWVCIWLKEIRDKLP
jgi:hypothetical protein